MKQGWIGLLSQHPIKWVGLNVSSTSLIREVSNSKRYPVEKPPNDNLNVPASTIVLHTPMPLSLNFTEEKRENPS